MKPAQNNRLAWAGAALVTRFASTWLAFLLAASFTQAATVTWLPISGTNDWFEPTNWSGGSVPTNADYVVITNTIAGNNFGVLLTNSTYSLGSILLTTSAPCSFPTGIPHSLPQTCPS